jgi:triacylglycerol lipase
MYFPPDFDRNRAIELGNLIQQAYIQYEDYTNKKTWNLNPEYTLKAQLYSQEGQKSQVPFGFIATKGNDFFVVFRGTVTPIEWLRDIEISQVNYLKDWGQVTKGFNLIYQDFTHTIKEVFQTAVPSANIYVTGHSLGAALANLCIADIVTNFPNLKPELYSFASPRTGDNTFAQAFKRTQLKGWRIANSEDIVPSLPLATIQIKDNEPQEIKLKLTIIRKILGGFQADTLA